jgi:CheY-like chemotaxis protein
MARRYDGTGLGLAMVKRLAELHGGSVNLDSAPNRGSTFTVWLPWHAAEPAPTESERQPTASPVPEVAFPAAAVALPSGGKMPLALIVEDDARAAELLRLQLQRNGFRVERAITAESALAIAAAECPDLITVDIHLPGMDGWTFIERIKQDLQLAKVPVVVVSIVADKIRGLTLGASYVLQKPVGRDELANALTASGFPATINGERRTVLVIDDNPNEVKLLGAYLKSTGYRVLTASSWQDGIDLARSKLPDLIVLDLMMPEVSGFEMVEVLKRDAATAAIPILVVTAKQVTEADLARLDGDVSKVIGKSGLDQRHFIGEVRQAISGTGA